MFFYKLDNFFKDCLHETIINSSQLVILFNNNLSKTSISALEISQMNLFIYDRSVNIHNAVVGHPKLLIYTEQLLLQILKIVWIRTIVTV